MKTTRVTLIAAFCPLFVFVLLTQAARAAIFGFGDFSSFTINKSTTDSGPAPNIFPAQDKIELTDNAGGETRSIFYDVPQSISTFSASFTYQEVNGSNASYQGATFVLQNTSAGPHAVAGSLGGFGYEGLAVFDPHTSQSAAISLELSNPTGTALYTGGNVTLGGANATVPVNLLSGDPINVALTYNGSILHETLTDSVTLATTSFSYAIDLPSILGSTSAYVGFTAQTPGAGFGFVPDQQYISNFNMPEPSSAWLLVIGGAPLALWLVRKRRMRPIAR